MPNIDTRDTDVLFDYPMWDTQGEAEPGLTWVCSIEEDQMGRVATGDALRLITIHNEVVEELDGLAAEFKRVNPEAFEAYWYAGVGE